MTTIESDFVIKEKGVFKGDPLQLSNTFCFMSYQWVWEEKDAILNQNQLPRGNREFKRLNNVSKAMLSQQRNLRPTLIPFSQTGLCPLCEPSACGGRAHTSSNIGPSGLITTSHIAPVQTHLTSHISYSLSALFIIPMFCFHLDYSLRVRTISYGSLQPVRHSAYLLQVSRGAR